MDDLKRLLARADALSTKLNRPRDGRDGAPGKDADVDAVKVLLERTLSNMRQPPSVDAAQVRDEVKRAVSSIVLRDGERGPRGPEGKQGDVGPMPRHEWHGTALRFQQPGGVWGESVDLRGPRGAEAGGRLPKFAGAGTFRMPNEFDLNSLGMADPSVIPDEIVINQGGVFRRMTWGAFVDLLPSAPPSGSSYANDYGDGYA